MLEISLSLAQTGSDWWNGLTKPRKMAYVKEHPKSKYAKQYAKERDAAIKGHKKGDKKRAKDDKKGSKHIKTLKARMKTFHADQKKFFAEGEHKPKSKERRTFGKMIKDKAKGIVTSVKAEGQEWKDAGKAVKKIATGKKLSKHEKHALKTVAIHTAMVVGPMAVTGGLSAGLAGMSKGLAVGMLEHSALIRGAQVLVFAGAVGAITDESSDEEALMHLVEALGDAFAEADLPNSVWADAAEKVGSRLEVLVAK